MSRRLLVKPLALLALSAGACLMAALPGISAPPPNRGEIAQAGRAQAGLNNAFSLDLFGQLRSKEGNLFCSPFSIRTALSMAGAGARGATADEMARVLHIEHADPHHRTLGLLAARLQPAAGAAYQLNVANALWVQQGFPLRDEFTQLLAKDYRSQLRPTDFEKNLDGSRVAINRWVEQQTADKIKDLLKPGILNPETKLVLVNAIYFKGKWAEAFKKDRTKDEPFFRADGATPKVPLMRQVDQFKFFENDRLQMVRLPYEKCPLEMALILPKKKGDLPAVEKGLMDQALDCHFQECFDADVDLALPRFKMTSEFDLGATLGAMGMPLAFTDDADFTGITSARRLKIDKVIHKAFVDVNEEGTEAAAATGVTMMPTAAPARERKFVTFRADHPFLLLLRDRESGAILFVGRVADPTK